MSIRIGREMRTEKMSLRWSTGNNFSWFLGPFLLIAHSDHLIFGINSNGHDEVVDEGWKVDVYDSNTQISISVLVSLAQIHFCYLNLIFSSVLPLSLLCSASLPTSLSTLKQGNLKQWNKAKSVFNFSLLFYLKTYFKCPPFGKKFL